jgi:hypothetical protein
MVPIRDFRANVLENAKKNGLCLTPGIHSIGGMGDPRAGWIRWRRKECRLLLDSKPGHPAHNLSFYSQCRGSEPLLELRPPSPFVFD